MATQILATKLFSPTLRPQAVARPHLLQKLNVSLHAKLTLVAAPAGFGKTTLIADWGRQLKADHSWEFVWLSLDEQDNQIERFFTYFVSALQKAAPAIGHSALSLLSAGPINDGTVVITDLINSLAAHEQNIALALDDYHLITNPAVHEAISFLVNNGPPQFHLVLITRSDPPMPLGRLRSHGLMNEIRQQDLRFAADETSQFFDSTMDLNLSEVEREKLLERTEGWIAGLQMAGLSMLGQVDNRPFIEKFSGSNRYIFDFLAEEVLATQSAETRRFLLQTSVLDRFCADLCDAVLMPASFDEGVEPTCSAEMLAYLDQANLFLAPLDNDRFWYRYHHLFADLLRQQLKKEMPDLVLGLHQRASRWFELAGLAEEAIEHALAAEDFDHAVTLLSSACESWLRHGELGKILRWVQRIPDEWQTHSPRLLFMYAWALLFRGAIADVEGALARLPADFSADLPLSAHVDVLRGTLALRQGDIARSIQLSKQAELDFSTFFSTSTQSDSDHIMQNVATLNLAHGYYLAGDFENAQRYFPLALAANRESDNLMALMNAFRGWGTLLVDLADLKEAEQIFREGVQVEQQWATRLGQPNQRLIAAAPLHVSLGSIYYEWNRLNDAEEQLEPAVELLQLSGQVNYSQGLLALAKVRLAQGRIDDVDEVAARLDKTLQAVNNQFSHREVTRNSIRLWCQLARYGRSEWKKRVEDALVTHEKELDDSLPLAHCLFALERWDEAQGLLESLYSRFESEKRKRMWLESGVLLALTHRELGHLPQAVKLLELIFDSAAASNYKRLFLDYGSQMAELLHHFIQQMGDNRYASQLLQELEAELESKSKSKGESDQAPLAKKPEPNPVRPSLLSRREVEVLKLIAQGLTNKEIAAELTIAPSTAKRHTVNVYNKLGVSNRAEATAQAYELGLK